MYFVSNNAQEFIEYDSENQFTKPRRRFSKLLFLGAVIFASSNCSSGTEPEKSDVFSTSAEQEQTISVGTILEQLVSIDGCTAQDPFPREEDIPTVINFLSDQAGRVGWSQELTSSLIEKYSSAGYAQTYQVDCINNGNTGYNTISVDGGDRVLGFGISGDCLSDNQKVELNQAVDMAKQIMPNPVIYTQSCLDETKPAELIK